MANVRGAKRRRIASVLSNRNRVAQAIADECGHLIIRFGHLAVGQVVYCADCRP